MRNAECGMRPSREGSERAGADAAPLKSVALALAVWAVAIGLALAECHPCDLRSVPTFYREPFNDPLPLLAPPPDGPTVLMPRRNAVALINSFGIRPPSFAWLEGNCNSHAPSLRHRPERPPRRRRTGFFSRRRRQQCHLREVCRSGGPLQKPELMDQRVAGRPLVEACDQLMQPALMLSTRACQ